MTVKAPRFSVVVNTYNRAPALLKTLASLRRLDYPDFEVIVVNGPSTDASKEVLASFGRDIKALDCPVANLSVSRNIGISHACGDVVAFIDDDAIPYPNWLAELAKPYDEERDVGGVGGFVWDHTGMWYQSRYIACNRFADVKNFKIFDPSDFYSFPGAAWYPSLMGTNCSFRREVLEKIGGFDETFAYFLDETDVCLRVVDAGHKIVFAPAAKVHHKFLPSHIRDVKRRTVHILPIARSKTHFALTHGLKAHGPRAARKFVDAWIAGRKIEAEVEYRFNTCTQAERAKTLAELKTGVDEGRSASFSNAHLRAAASGWRAFPALKRGRRIALISADFPPQANGGIGVWLRSVGLGLSGLGGEIHVITRARDFENVDFEEGMWIHRVRPRECRDACALNGEPLDLPPNIKDWGQAASDRIGFIASDFGKVDFVVSPIWDLEGCFTFDSSEFTPVVSLHTTYGMSLDSHPEWAGNPAYYRDFVAKMLEAERRVLTSGPFLLANSEGLLRAIESGHGVKIDKTRARVIPHGVKDLLEAAPRPVDSGTGVRGLFVGRLELRKGADVLFEALPGLFARFENLTFDVVGDAGIPVYGTTTLVEKYRATLEPHLKSGRLRVHGKVDEERLPGFYNACDFFAAPSRFESFGLILAEAMSCGKPVIACRAGGMPEVVGDAGLLAQPGSREDLARCVSELAADRDLRLRLGRLARKRYEEKFSLAGMNAGISQLLEELSDDGQTR